jgi:hypothetical protein
VDLYLTARFFGGFFIFVFCLIRHKWKFIISPERKSAGSRRRSKTVGGVSLMFYYFFARIYWGII